MDQPLGPVYEYIGRTSIHPLILLLTFCFIAFVLFAPKNYVMIPLLIVQSFITSAQRVSPGGIDFPILRLLMCITFIRIFLRKEHSYLILNKLDKIILVYGLVSIVTYSLQVPAMSSVVFSVGVFIDNIGGYFLVRILVRKDSDFKIIVKTLLVSAVILVFFFLFESLRGVNLLNSFDANPLSPIIRDGRIRAQGAYSHPILAGSFWAAIVPLFLGFCTSKGKQDLTMYAGALAGMAVIFLCASSTPVMSLAFGLGATVLFYQRASLTDFKLFLIAIVIGLMLFWNKPIWYLFTKIDIAGGSTGYFRYLLIDQFVKHARDWMLIGVRSTYYWGEGLGLASVGLADLPNQFVLEGVRGGGVGLALFLASIFTAFRYIGKILKISTSNDERMHVWQLGVSLLVHMFSFLGVSYFGQVKFAWWMTIAIAGCLYQRRISEGLSYDDAVEEPRLLRARAGN